MNAVGSKVYAKCSDIPDAYVLTLALEWNTACDREGQAFYAGEEVDFMSRPVRMVGEVMVADGIPEWLMCEKVEQLCDQDLLDYGTSPRSCFLTEKGESLLAKLGSVTK